MVFTGIPTESCSYDHCRRNIARWIPAQSSLARGRSEISMRLGGGRRADLERSCTWRARAEFDRELEMQPAKMILQRQRRGLCRDHSARQMNQCADRAIIVGDRLVT